MLATVDTREHMSHGRELWLVTRAMWKAVSFWETNNGRLNSLLLSGTTVVIQASECEWCFCVCVCVFKYVCILMGLHESICIYVLCLIFACIYACILLYTCMCAYYLYVYICAVCVITCACVYADAHMYVDVYPYVCGCILWKRQKKRITLSSDW